MRHAIAKLLCLLCLPWMILFAGCGSTSSGSFTLTASSPVTLAQGSSKTFTVTANGASDFKGAVSVSASGLPAGVTLSPASATISPGGSATFTATASSSAVPGTSTVTLQGVSGSLNATATVSLVVTAASGPGGPGGGGPADFALSVTPGSLTLAAGASAPVTLTATGVNGFSGSIDVMLSGLPAGVTTSPKTITVTPGTPTVVTLMADTTVATTTVPATVSFMGGSGALSHSAPLALSLTGTGTAPGSTGDFQLSLSKTSLQLMSGGSDAPVVATITGQDGFTGAVNLTVSGLPAGVTVDSATSTASAGAPHAFRFTADTTAALVTTDVTVTGTVGSITHTAHFALSVISTSAPQDFSLMLAPSSRSVAPGSVATTTLSAIAINGYNGSISMAVSGLPAGVTLAQTSFNLATGAPVQLTFNISSVAAAGTSNIILTGVSGSLEHQVAFTLTIQAASNTADFSLALTPPSTSISQNSIGQTSLSASALNGFNGQINVTTSGLPSGVAISPSSFTLATGTPRVLTLTVPANATTGVYSVVLTGTSGATTHQTTLTLTITPAGTGDFTLSLNPATLSFKQGSSGSTTLSATATGGFTGAIAVSTGALPKDVVVTPSSTNLTAGTPVSITLAAASTTPSGTYTIIFTGVNGSGSLSRTVALTLTVTPSEAGADFTLAATPNAISVDQGEQSPIVHLTATGSNGFNGKITYVFSGIPAGVTSIPVNGSFQSGNPESIAFQVANNVAVGSYPITITGTSGSLSHTATVTLTVTAPTGPETVTITLTPSSLTVPVGSFGAVTVTANGPSGYTGPIQMQVLNLPKGVTANPSTFTANAGVAQTVVLTASASAQAGSSTLTFFGTINSVQGTATLNLLVVQQAATGFDVTTWHYDNGRTGLDAFETKLTPANVTSAKFGKLNSNAADASVDAQPLFVSAVTIGGQAHNVLYVVTENDTVYAYDADSGTKLWEVSALGANETASDDHGCSEVSPKIGITATPVIDRNYPPNGAIFFVAMTKDSSNNYHHRLHALDLTTGAELSGSPTEITATYKGTGVSSDGTTNSFDPALYVERSALLLSNGTVYLTWAAPCRQSSFDYSSWVMAYSEATLQQQSVLNLTPNGSGGAIWMSGAGPAANSDGFVYFATSEGTFDTTPDAKGFPIQADYGNGFVKVQATNGVMSVYDYFEPVNGVPGSFGYADQGSGGVMLSPAVQGAPSILIGAGKDGNIYQMYSIGGPVVMGEYADGVSDNNQQTDTGVLANGATSSPAFFNNLYYYGGGGDALKSFDPADPNGSINDQSLVTLGAAGATPVISANGTNAAILWALDTTAGSGPVLHAFDITDLTKELYNSTQAQTSGAPRDTVSATGRYTVPVVVNGRVYIGTQSGVDVFGLLP